MTPTCRFGIVGNSELSRQEHSVHVGYFFVLSVGVGFFCYPLAVIRWRRFFFYPLGLVLLLLLLHTFNF